MKSNSIVKYKDRLSDYFIKSGRIGKIDIIFLVIVSAAALLLFSQGNDINITIKHAVTYLDSLFNGKIFSFYGIVYKNAINGVYYSATAVDAANYSFLLYTIIALINLPVYLIDLMVAGDIPLIVYMVWNKLFLAVFAGASAFFLINVAKKIGMSEKRSRWVGYAFLASPIILFGSFAFGQYDIISVFFVILALSKFVDRKLFVFSCFMAIAIDIKTFPIFAFGSLLLLAEKRIHKIIQYGFVGLSLFLTEKIVFSFSEGKQLTNEAMSEAYYFKERLYMFGIESMELISFIIVGVIIIFFLAYRKKIKTSEDLVKSMLIYPLAIYTVFFVFIIWHPQWLVVIMPFTILAMFYFENLRLAMLIDIVMSAGYLIFTNLRFFNNVDASMINNGILPAITGNYLDNSSSIFHFFYYTVIDMPTSVYFSVFAAGIVTFLIVKVMGFNKKEAVNYDDTNEPIERWLIWIRLFLVVLLFMLPVLAVYFKG